MNYLQNDKLKALQNHFSKLSNSQTKNFGFGKSQPKKVGKKKPQKFIQVKNENPYIAAKNSIKKSPQKDEFIDEQKLSSTFELASNQHQFIQQQKNIGLAEQSLTKKSLADQFNQNLQEQQLNSPVFQKTGNYTMNSLCTYNKNIANQSLKQQSQQEQFPLPEKQLKENNKHQNTIQERIIKNQKMVESATSKYQAQFEGKVQKFFHKMTNKKFTNEKSIGQLNITSQSISLSRNFVTENIARQGTKQKKLLNLSQPKIPFNEEKSKKKEQIINKKMEIYNYYIELLRKIELIKFTINMPQLKEGLTKFDELIYFIEIDNIKIENEIESKNFQLITAKYGQEYYILLKKIYNLFAIEKNGDMAFNTRQMLNFLKVFNIMKNYPTLTQTQIEIFCSKETIHKKGINFIGFLEIMFSISKILYDDETLQTELKFKLFIDEQIKPEFMAISNRLIDYNIEKIKVFFQPYNSFENPTVELFLECDDFLKHVFSIYQSKDFKYSKESYLTLNNFIKMSKNYEIIPNLCHYQQIIKLFRIFQDGKQEKIFFSQFIMILCCIAHIAFSAPEYEDEFKGFYKKIWKLFEILIEANCKYSEGIMNWSLSKLKE